jgi:hypothetical protein
MNSEYYNQIAKSTAHRKSRDYNKDFLFCNPDYLKHLLDIALNVKDKNHHKACWILELLCEEKMALFLSFLDDFCETLSHYKNDSAIRSISKICLFLSNSKKYSLTEKQEEMIIETCLDWLIESNKAANVAYAMRTLYNLGKKHHWVHGELKVLLQRECGHQTPGYKSAVKDILKRLK